MSSASGRDLSAVAVPERPAEAPSASPEMHDAHFAVVVGINRYPGFTDLDGPLDDAADFVDWLVSPAGGAVPKGNVFEVPAPREHEAGLAVHQARPNVYDVVDALRSVNLAIGAQTEADPGAWLRSRLYLFVAGHGMVPDGSDAGALFTADASAAELGHNINLLLYKVWYQQCGRFRDVVVFADLCRTMMLDAPSFGPPFSRAPARQGEVRTVMGYGTGFDGRAFEGPAGDRVRGHFTTALLRNLRRAGTAQHPTLRWGDLRGMIGNTLRDLVPDGCQRADCTGDDDVEFGPPAGGRPDRPDDRCRVRIGFPDGAGGPVDLLDGALEVIGSWAPADGEWRLTLAPGLYQLVRQDTREELRGFAVMGVDVDVCV